MLDDLEEFIDNILNSINCFIEQIHLNLRNTVRTLFELLNKFYQKSVAFLKSVLEHLLRLIKMAVKISIILFKIFLCYVPGIILLVCGLIYKSTILVIGGIGWCVVITVFGLAGNTSFKGDGKKKINNKTFISDFIRLVINLSISLFYIAIIPAIIYGLGLLAKKYPIILKLFK